MHLRRDMTRVIVLYRTKGTCTWVHVLRLEMEWSVSGVEHLRLRPQTARIFHSTPSPNSSRPATHSRGHLKSALWCSSLVNVRKSLLLSQFLSFRILQLLNAHAWLSIAALPSSIHCIISIPIPSRCYHCLLIYQLAILCHSHAPLVSFWIWSDSSWQ